MSKEVILGIGTNLGDREENIAKALELLSENINIYGVSSFYYNKALLPENAPSDWNREYLNIVIVGETKFSAEELLQFILKTEVDMGRGEHLKWSPRIIDIDIIMYNNETYNLPHLQIPHPHYKKRDFVLVPLEEIRSKCKYLVF